MISFENDYAEGCHPKLLEALARTNLEQLPGYGEDRYTRSAAEKILEAAKAPDGEVFLINGGTMANQLVIDTMLHPTEGAIAAVTGHINVHEAGAVEFTGHKVIPLPGHEGKLDAEEVRRYLEGFYADGSHTHMVFPGLVYISHPTELGTLYTKRELEALHEMCQSFDIPLFLDGARLGYGLMAPGTDIALPDVAALTDVFYIGGTKVGALSGEAVVFPHGNTPRRFVTSIKQHGDMAAKGRLLGVQFDTLFTGGLYFKAAAHGMAMAEKLKEVFRSRGYRFLVDSPTNQQFVILANGKLEELAKQVRFSVWERYDEGHTVARFATSWATPQENIDMLASILDSLA